MPPPRSGLRPGGFATATSALIAWDVHRSRDGCGAGVAAGIGGDREKRVGATLEPRAIALSGNEERRAIGCHGAVAARVTVALGVILDTMIVRSVLVTAINMDLGGKIWWPSKIDTDDAPLTASSTWAGPSSRASRRTSTIWRAASEGP